LLLYVLGVGGRIVLALGILWYRLSGISVWILIFIT
jgi:hypothetical protein